MAWLSTRTSRRRGLLLAPLIGIGLLVSWPTIKAFRIEAQSLHPAFEKISMTPELQALGSEELSLTTVGGTHVSGWLIPSRRGAYIIYVHGSTSDRRGLLPEALALARAGYGAVLLDIPGHGESRGSATWGAPARNAIRAAVDMLTRRSDVRAIGAYGFSMGTGVVADVAADDPRIRAVALAGVFSNVRDQIRCEFAGGGVASQLGAVWGAAASGLDMEELIPTSRVARIAPRPLLLIAGADDAVVPTAMTRLVFDAARDPKELLVVAHAGHGTYARAMGGRSYFDKLQAFFDRALAADT
jgi:pimeloyl-ACP methyl ester carboxylesterase